MSERRFHIDPTGAVTGPGLYVPREHQIVRGHVVLSVDLLNQLFELAAREGKLAEDAQRRAIRERVRGAVEDLAEDFGIDLETLR